MKVRELIEALGNPQATGDLDTEISKIAYDSRQAASGVLFAALRGTHSDGHEYIYQALDAGASAIVAETPPFAESTTPWIHVPDSREALACLSARFYSEPSKELLVSAVTGTNGKTTTAFLIHHLLNAAHVRCGLIGTISWDTGAGKSITATHTTPESLELQGLLAQMRDNGCRACSMEASSHALHQHRMDAVQVSAAIFTNLTQDHLDYHGSMEDYFKAKVRLFEMAAERPEGKLIINIDDKWGRRLAEQFENHPGLRRYGFTIGADYRASDARCDTSGTSYELEHKDRSLLVRLPLVGLFNVHNSLGAVVAAHMLGCNFRESVTALKDAPQVPGRMERVTDRERFKVFVDYAHTPDGLINALGSARALRPTRIITVFGCGGDRDRTKRPLMARAVEEGSDICILTSDNPRTEDPIQIMEDARKGFSRQTHALVADRREAIKQAMLNARDGDLVLIAGKGHETYQDIEGVKHPFDDRKVGRGYLNLRKEEF
ncbi:MAG: UDP-N-acetylmuramoyl-L-alanyl-D-glutamate--2,6-diaminopimelate ligase [Verrucomicrobia bacterium]|nr:UDP-N-acetylmuramoyl-L-alanyl-D-glutamate--2,6-diaminopimelate ligase [Verrucomicrobiota bacterium]